MSWFNFSWQNFWFSFLALAFEGLPFVLVGSLISGFIAAFVPSRIITRFLPKNRFLATLVSGLLGLVFPVCECGVVPVVRRLLDKGLPLSCGLTYMLASPIVNPLVAISTYAAFRGQHPDLNTAVRLISGYLVAVVVGPGQEAVAAEARRIRPQADIFVQTERRGTAHAALAAEPAIARGYDDLLVVFDEAIASCRAGMGMAELDRSIRSSLAAAGHAGQPSHAVAHGV